MILEVGLGGRYDAVNAIDTDCAVITSIDLDHTEYLGPDRESIGLEKAQIMRRGRPAIVSDPLPPRSVVAHAEAVGADLWLVGRDFSHSGDRQQWSWQGRDRRYNGLAYPSLRGANQLLNASGVLAVFEALRERLPVPAQAVRQGLATIELPGRFQIVPGEPTLVLDVAHNPHAVAALALNLDQMGFYPRTHAVFGAMRDKDLAGVIARVAPLIDAWYCTDLPLPRAASAAHLARHIGDVATRRGDEHACRSVARRWPPPSRRPTPLIEFWCSARFSPWVACCGKVCRAWAPDTRRRRCTQPLAHRPRPAAPTHRHATTSLAWVCFPTSSARAARHRPRPPATRRRLSPWHERAPGAG